MDNGSPYRNEQLSLICGSRGTVELHTKVRDGASKGKIERLFRTMKETWLHGLNTKQIFSIEALNRELFEFIKRYNSTLHSSTGEKPLERYICHINRIRQPESKEWLDDCFINRQTRKVYNDSTLTIFHVSFDAPMQFIGMKVQVRYLPDALDKAYIFTRKHYLLHLTDKVANSKTKRNNGPSINYDMAEVSRMFKAFYGLTFNPFDKGISEKDCFYPETIKKCFQD